MNTEISNNETGGGGGSTNAFDELFKDEYAVMLLQGKNSFGDMIYSYVKVALPNIKLLYAALNSGKDFAPSEFGTIIASGKGIPSEELKNEMSATYDMLNSANPSFSMNKDNMINPAALKKKAWDEY